MIDIAKVQADITAVEAAAQPVIAVLDPAALAPVEAAEAAINSAVALGTQLYGAVSAFRSGATETWAQISAQTKADFAAFEAMLAARNAQGA
jgi:Zn-dependent M32 family carboxypeptidase